MWPAEGAGPPAEEDVRQELEVAYRRFLESPNTELRIARKDEQVIALMDLSFRETFLHRGSAMIIEDLVVDRAYRRAGIGRRLVQLAEQIARQRACRGIELQSDLHRKETHSFWEAMGYERRAYQFCRAL